MMRDEFGLRVGGRDERLRRAPVKRLAAAPEQALVGRILDEGVLETIGREGGVALDEQQIRFGQLVERGL